MIIKEYQRSGQLIPDGIIGAKTAALMRWQWDMSKTELAHFLGQSHHETAGFRAREENLNYSAGRLRVVFPKYFTKDMASRYAGNSEMIANIVYANRMGNGDICTEDGYRFRGRGSMMLTGRDNYAGIGRAFGVRNIVDHPHIVGDEYFWISGIKYFQIRDVWRYCGVVNPDSIYRVTTKINGGTNGLNDRVRWTNHYLRIQG